jgi:hypothetical protein
MTRRLTRQRIPRLLGAMGLVMAMTALIGASAVSAQTDTPAHSNSFYLCANERFGEACLVPASHNTIYTLSANPDSFGTVSFINRYIYNGHAWWEIRANNGLCLNNVGDVEADSCLPGDPFELWYNHDPGLLLNLAGNLRSHIDTYLEPLFRSSPLLLSVQFVRYTGWCEIPAGSDGCTS